MSVRNDVVAIISVLCFGIAFFALMVLGTYLLDEYFGMETGVALALSAVGTLGLAFVVSVLVEALMTSFNIRMDQRKRD